MGVFTRADSAVFWLYLEPLFPGDRGLKERTAVRCDAPDALLRKENRALAERLYHERMAKRASGALGEQRKPVITLKAFAAWFTAHKLPHRRGREREAWTLERLVKVLGARPLSELTPAVVTQYWITPRLAERHTVNGRTFTAGPSTVNREVDVLKAVLNAAVPEYLERSPLFGMKRLKTTTPRRRLLHPDEERRLLPHFAPDDRALFLIGVDSLVRLGDILDLKWTDWRGDTLYIADPKAGGGFSVPLSRRARTALEALPRSSSPYIFARRRLAESERDRRAGIRKMLQRACAACDPPIPYGRANGGVTFHWATRRTGATRMLTSGVDIGTVQKVGAWSTPNVVLGIYHELLDEKARAAVEAVGPQRKQREQGGNRERRSALSRPSRDTARRGRTSRKGP